MNVPIACFLFGLSAALLPAQDVVKVAPSGTVKVEYEDSQVRVLRFKEAPGIKIAMHSHPPYVAVGLTNDVSKYTFPDGKTADQTDKAGEVQFSKGVTHASENTGKTKSEAVFVELKTAPAGTVLTGEGDMVAGNPSMTKVETDNEYVRVTRVTVPPHATLAMHTHPSRYVVVYLSGGSVKTTTADGKATTAKVAPGAMHANAPVKHSNENLGSKPTEAVVIELKTAEK